jgi:hypothetical protein
MYEAIEAQKVMDAAYEKWQANKEWSYSDFVNHLDYLEKVVVVTGNLNYQVENGGFMQWHDNGYSTANSTLVWFLENELATDASKEVAKLIRTCVGRYAQVDTGRNRWSNFDDDDDSDPYTNDLSNQYYELNDALMNDLEAYVVRKQEQAQ